MGLDNFPEPYPCSTLQEANKLEIIMNKFGNIDCDATNCPFIKINTWSGCWIRGKVFNKYIQESCGASLYTDKTRQQLDLILQSLKRHYKHEYLEKKRTGTAALDLQFLIKYFETLLSIQGWNGKLVADF